MKIFFLYKFSLSLTYLPLVLNRLFDLQNPPVSLKVQKKIADLLKMYLTEDPSSPLSSTELESDDDVIYTLESIIPTKDSLVTETPLPVFNIPEPEHHEIPSNPTEPIETWTKCAGILIFHFIY